MSSIVGPSLDSVLPKTILPMEVIMVSRYTDPVESSQTILLALMLETLGIIPSTAATSVEAPRSSWGGVIGHTPLPMLWWVEMLELQGPLVDE